MASKLDIISSLKIENLLDIAQCASDAIMSIYKTKFDHQYKQDQSPLTEADKQAHLTIHEGLTKINQDIGLNIPILSEEGEQAPYEIRKTWDYLWLVDPLDGTKEFIKKNDEFTVNIALIHQQRPILGIVQAPALNNTVYYALCGQGAYKNGHKLPIQSAESPNYQVVTSRSHLSPETGQFIETLPTKKPKKLLPMGSSLKICLVAEGAADIYPRLGPTMEWDTAAAHAIVIEAGKTLKPHPTGTQPDMLYNKRELTNPHFIVQ